jgi:integrase
MTFYKAVYKPAIVRANRLNPDAKIDGGLRFHSLRHTYASLCVAAGISAEKLSRRMGRAKIGTTLGIYVHLFQDADADAADMAALAAMADRLVYGANVLPFAR